MIHYQIWFDLKNKSSDHEFQKNVKSFLDLIKQRGLILDYLILRRKFGFGPEGIGEFNIHIVVDNIDTLDKISELMIKGDKEILNIHKKMAKFIKNIKYGLYKRWMM